MHEDLCQKSLRERLYEKIADHIEALIGSGKLQEGDRLPPERE